MSLGRCREESGDGGGELRVYCRQTEANGCSGQPGKPEDRSSVKEAASRNEVNSFAQIGYNSHRHVSVTAAENNADQSQGRALNR